MLGEVTKYWWSQYNVGIADQYVLYKTTPVPFPGVCCITCYSLAVQQFGMITIQFLPVIPNYDTKPLLWCTVQDIRAICSPTDLHVHNYG